MVLTAPAGNIRERVTMFPALKDNASLCLAPTTSHTLTVVSYWEPVVQGFDLFTFLLMLLTIGLSSVCRLFS